MAANRSHVALDANVLIAGTRLPRWPYEVMQAALQGQFTLVLPDQVVVEARRHMDTAAQRTRLDRFLGECAHERLPLPSRERVLSNLDLVRSKRDVPIALALLDAQADIFVSNDRDFTEEGATAERFSQQVLVMLPAVFLREVLDWSSDALEAIRHRTWRDIDDEEQQEPSQEP